MVSCLRMATHKACGAPAFRRARSVRVCMQRKLHTSCKDALQRRARGSAQDGASLYSPLPPPLALFLFPALFVAAQGIIRRSG